jgi:hypothetical protein
MISSIFELTKEKKKKKTNNNLAKTRRNLKQYDEKKLTK